MRRGISAYNGEPDEQSEKDELQYKITQEGEKLADRIPFKHPLSNDI
jgi:hypothetical protein